MKNALEGLRVIDLGNVLAGPFTTTMLADFGADVIKCEVPDGGDLIRGMGRIKDLWYAVENRNKRNITLNLKTEKGKELLWDLLKDADVVVENFRPGVFKRLGFTWEKMHEHNPRLIYCSASGYGQTGPNSHKPAFDRIGAAQGGLLHVTGFPDGPPIKAGLSVVDFLTAQYGVIGIMFALYSRDVLGTGVGQHIDACLTESVIRITESILAEYSYEGYIRNRTGNAMLVTIPSGHFLTKDNEYLILTVAGDKVFEAFARNIGRPDLLESEEYSTAAGRTRNREELNQLAADWAKEHTIDECLAALGDDVPNCKAYNAADIASDPHFKFREAIVKVQTEKFGEILMQNAVPKMSGTPGKVKWPGGALGLYNDEVYTDVLGLSKEKIEELKAEGVI